MDPTVGVTAPGGQHHPRGTIAGVSRRARTLRPLDDSEAARLRAAELTYLADRLGTTLDGEEPPPGYQRLRAARVVGHGRDHFEAAVAALDDWQVQRRSGAAVRADGGSLTVGTVAVVRLALPFLGFVGVDAPVRIVDVVDEDDRRGFAYGTLPGHPEEGEEAFVLSIADDGVVRFTVDAFSRPASRLARLGGPLTSTAQAIMTRRYLAALETP